MAALLWPHERYQRIAGCFLSRQSGSNRFWANSCPWHWQESAPRPAAHGAKGRGEMLLLVPPPPALVGAPALPCPRQEGTVTIPATLLNCPSSKRESVTLKGNRKAALESTGPCRIARLCLFRAQPFYSAINLPARGLRSVNPALTSLRAA